MDSSVYDSLVRLAQPWKMRYPLVEMQGNMGNVFGDKPAASRYTECRLTPIGELMSKGVKTNAVPMINNYSGETTEPLILPSIFPNALVNPNLGIAVGMSSTTASHNLTEITNALIAELQKGGMLTPAEVLQHVKGPDFPTGGVIINPENFATIVATGKGSLKLRSQYRIETINKKPTIIITEVPYLVTIEDKIRDKIKAMVEDGYTDIEHYENHSGHTGFELRIICKSGANMNKVVADLCSKTGFQTSINLNNTMLVNGKPQPFTYPMMFHAYLEARHAAVKRESEFKIEKIQHQIEVAEGLKKALLHIDEIIVLIKAAENKNAARVELISQYGFSEVQANAILDIKLSRLTKLEYIELDQQIADLQRELEHLAAIINNAGGARTQELINQLTLIRDQYGDERRTKLLAVAEYTSEDHHKDTIDAAYTASEEVVTIVSKDGVQEFSAEEFRNNSITKKLPKEEWLYFEANLPHNRLHYATTGQFTNEITPETCGNFELSNGKWVVTLTKNGYIKKTLASAYNWKRSSALCKVKESDTLFFAGIANDDDYLLALLENGNVVKLSIADLTANGKATIGTKLATAVCSAVIAKDTDTIFVVSEDKGKLTMVSDYVVGGRTSSGQKVADNTTHLLKNDTTYFAVDARNKVKEINPNKFTKKGKTAQGSKITTAKIKYLAS